MIEHFLAGLLSGLQSIYVGAPCKALCAEGLAMEYYPWALMVWCSDQAYTQAKAMMIFCHEGFSSEGIVVWDVCVGHRVLPG